MVRRQLGRSAVVALGAAVLLMVSSTAARAHYAYVYHGSDLATVSSDHLRGSLCDQESDGHAVYGEYLLDGGYKQPVWDSSAHGLCNTGSFGWYGPAEAFRLCEQLSGPDSCTAWKSA